MKNYQDIINILDSSEYYKIKINIDSLIHNQDFIKIIITIKNPIIFDRFIKMCEYKTDTSEIYEARKDYIKKSLDKLNENNVYQFFGLDKMKEIMANRYLTEYIISYYFQDNYYNFMTNLYQMVNYLEISNKKLIATENIRIYEKFVELKKMSLNEKIKLFHEYLKVNLMEMFYDDISIVKSDSHKELTKKVLKLDKNNNIYQQDLSAKLGVDVYYLDGEEFYGFVRCLSLNSYDLMSSSDYVLAKTRRLGYSFSYISHNNIGTIDHEGRNVALFYSDINPDNIMYVHHADLQAKKMEKQNDYVSVKENEITTPDSLIARTKNYNEIYIKNQGNGIRPTALICYDTITGSDIDFAKKYGLSILLINCEKYKRYERFDDYDTYSYIV